LYAARFPAYAAPDLGAYRFYRFRIERLKVFDEAVFGAGVFVTATVHGGQRLIWERTDISSGAQPRRPRSGRRCLTGDNCYGVTIGRPAYSTLPWPCSASAWRRSLPRRAGRHEP
jgi:hypothetical protein